MPKSRGRRTNRTKKKHSPRRAHVRPAGKWTVADDLPPIDRLVESFVGGKDEIGTLTDPLEAELWASSMTGVTYKMPLPLSVQQRFLETLWSGVIAECEERAGTEHLARLRALASVADDAISKQMTAAADHISATGITEPIWSDVVGRPEFVGAWTFEDPFGDQRGYYSNFRYEGRPEHTVSALYDHNLGGIVKDAFAGYLGSDARKQAEQNGLEVIDADSAEMAGDLLYGIEIGDMYIDNEWTKDFKSHRGLLQSRMRILGQAREPHRVEFQEETRKALIDEFVKSKHGQGLEDSTALIEHALDARCDYGGGDPLRWSPIVVELFMMDFLPRKVTLDTGQIRVLPELLRRWVRFCLEKKGLAERWISQTEKAVDRWAPEFKRAATDPGSFGMAKSFGQAMLAAGVDLSDEAGVDKWIKEFNERPFEERDEILRGPDFPIN